MTEAFRRASVVKKLDGIEKRIAAMEERVVHIRAGDLRQAIREGIKKRTPKFSTTLHFGLPERQKGTENVWWVPVASQYKQMVYDRDIGVIEDFFETHGGTYDPPIDWDRLTPSLAYSWSATALRFIAQDEDDALWKVRMIAADAEGWGFRTRIEKSDHVTPRPHRERGPYR